MGSAESGRALRVSARLALVVGGLISFALMLYTGRNAPAFLQVAFALWVPAPFVMMFVTEKRSARWSARTQSAIAWLTIAISVLSVAIYVHRVPDPPKAQAAFVFVAVPPVSVVIVAAVALFGATRRT